MPTDDERLRRAEARNRTRRDIDRLQRRESDAGFWPSLALIGSVGWPIALLATGGALLGQFLDSRFGTGIHFTLTLLVLGTATGGYVAYRALRENGS